MTIKAHSNRLKRLAKVRPDLMAAARLIEDSAKASIVSMGGAPSVAGAPPNNQTGALVAGIYSEPMGENGARVVSSDSASASLEFGRSNAEPRPFLRPAVQKNIKAITKVIANKVRIDLKRT